MAQSHYSFNSTDNEFLFSFISEGPNGNIEKRVQFSPMDGVTFNLGFGDWIEENGEIDDMAVPNNGDIELVLGTVIQVLRFFLSEHAGARVFLTGSTPARTRLYRLIINTNFDVIKAEFDIAGFRNGKWSRFEKNVDYESFMVSKLF
ncbi:DUF6934 family protein [Dyadobacter jiangsuensis]|uniref:Uncharacterized protein n=1 Tax=Dyadobacter jiangsuensis TaxID=1591085 RepID=A0A2P8FSI0_9BACT|nr:hypothetical protein [Dyadobacter jiangsuensis]PSL24677.1 hypothetical protein CLV60_113101 [Dyadobacter jiangsuensis]